MRKRGKANKNNAIRNIIGPYTSAKRQKKEMAHAPKENMPKTQHDTDDTLEAAKNGKRQMGAIQASEIWPMTYVEGK